VDGEVFFLKNHLQIYDTIGEGLFTRALELSFYSGRPVIIEASVTKGMKIFWEKIICRLQRFSQKSSSDNSHKNTTFCLYFEDLLLFLVCAYLRLVVTG
jgi:hypothetical protein